MQHSLHKLLLKLHLYRIEMEGHIMNVLTKIVVINLMTVTTIAYSNKATASEFHHHEKHDSDSAQLRAEASESNYWRDSNAAHPNSWTRFKILGFNDFHGQLEARVLFGRPAGGAAVLASYLETEANESDNGALIVHAGDHVGASPPISALLHDEPSISFLNILANEECEEEYKLNPKCNLIGTLGNHEFDEGVNEMQRLINGGIHADGPFLDDNYKGAKFPYVNANVINKNTGKTILPAYVIKRVKGMPIAFIGAVLKQTPSIVTPSGVAGVDFLDEATAINSYVPELKRKGVRAIVVTIHQGTRQSFFNGPTNTNPQDLGSAIGDIVRNLDDEIDIVVSGHAHGFTNQLVQNKNGKQILVTQAFSASTAYADIDVAIDPRSKDIVEKSAAIITTFGDTGPGLKPNKKVTTLVASAAKVVAPLVNRIIGETTTDILRLENAAGESALGNLIADAQRTAMNTDIAFMNPGGIRADITAGQVTWGALFTVQPFANDLVQMTLTGEQIIRLLNQQWANPTRTRIMKTSGIQYIWDASQPAANRIIGNSVVINGQPIDMLASYTVTVNSFMAAGGDGFTVLTEGTNRVIGPVDLDALVTHISTLPQPFTAILENRIQRLN